MPSFDKAAYSLIGHVYEQALIVTPDLWGVDPGGIRDSGAQINRALEYAKANNVGMVVIPKGRYILEVPIILQSNVWMCGMGFETVLQVKSNTDITPITCTGLLFEARISHMTIDGNKQNNSFSNGGDGINVAISHSFIDHLRVKNIQKTAIRVNDDGNIYNDTGFLNFVQYNHLEDNTDGIKWGWRVTDSWCEYNNIGSSHANLVLEGGTGRFIGNHFDGDPEYNVLIPNGVDTMAFWNNLFENAGKHAIYGQQPSFRDNIRKLNISCNIIRNASRESAGTYDLIHIEGYDATTKTTGVLITGNTFVSNDTHQARYCVYLKTAENVTIEGNDTSSAHTATEPIWTE